VIQDNLLEYAVALLVMAVPVVAVLVALYFVVRLAVEHGVRRAQADPRRPRRD
jgi:hypothetical protein